MTSLDVILRYIGNQSNPIENVTIRGITFRDTEYTYLLDHGMPSGGDWALQRTGAIYIEGAINMVIESNLFTRLDGNAISINRFTRNITIFNNEIAWNG